MIKNGIYNALVVLSGPLINLISIPIAAKALGTNSFGEASVAISFISYFSIISTLGLTVYGTRELAAANKDLERFSIIFSELLLLSICASVAGAIIYATIACLLIPTPTPILLIGIFSLLVNFFNVEWLYYAKENYKIVAYSTVLARVIGLGLIYTFVKNSSDTYIYVAILLLSNLLPNLIVFSLYRLYTNMVISNLQLSKHLKVIGSFLSIRIFSSIYSVLDIVMVGLIAGATIAGLYSIAIRVARIMTSVICSMTAVAMPRASALYTNNNGREYNALLVNTLTVTLMLSSVAFACVILLSNVVVLYLGGDQFKAAASALALLSFLAPIVALSNFLAMQILYPNKNEKGVLISLVCGSFTYLIVAPILLLFIQLKGAAAAVVFSEITILLIQIYLAKNRIVSLLKGEKSRLQRLAGLTIAFYSVCIIIYHLTNGFGVFPLIVILLTTLILYLIGLIIIKEPMINYVIARLDR